MTGCRGEGVKGKSPRVGSTALRRAFLLSEPEAVESVGFFSVPKNPPEGGTTNPLIDPPFMSPLEVIQLVGYATGAILTFWMSALLRRWRRGLGGLERVLFALGMGIGLWHTSNFALTVLGLFQAAPERWPWLLRLSDTVAVISIVFSYSFLLHIHLYLWANAKGRGLNRIEKLRVWASYVPVLFLSVSVPHIWTGKYVHMLVKLAEVRLPFPQVNYVHAFMLWAIYVLCLIALTELFIARIIPNQTQRRIMRLLQDGEDPASMLAK